MDELRRQYAFCVLDDDGRDRRIVLCRGSNGTLSAALSTLMPWLS
jgi:hypothetical protein